MATGLSIGSGGSGGIFGPGMVIGAFIGASVWRLFEPIVPSMGHNPAPFVIVGMMCCFGSISRAPLAVMLMVAEMTGSLSILAPAMIAVGLAWFIVRRGDDTIYRSQLKSRADAPAQRLLTGMPVLSAVVVGDAMAPHPLVIPGGHVRPMRRRQLDGRRRRRTGGRRPGSFQGDGVHRRPRSGRRRGRGTLAARVDPSAPTVPDTAHLDVALDALTTSPAAGSRSSTPNARWSARSGSPTSCRGYRLGLLSSLQDMDAAGDHEGTNHVPVDAGSPLVGHPLRRSASRSASS